MWIVSVVDLILSGREKLVRPMETSKVEDLFLVKHRILFLSEVVLRHPSVSVPVVVHLALHQLWIPLEKLKHVIVWLMPLAIPILP